MTPAACEEARRARVTLEPFGEDYWREGLRWYNDPEIIALTSDDPNPLTEPQFRELIQADLDRATSAVFGIRSDAVAIESRTTGSTLVVDLAAPDAIQAELGPDDPSLDLWATHWDPTLAYGWGTSSNGRFDLGEDTVERIRPTPGALTWGDSCGPANGETLGWIGPGRARSR